jgi:phospholipase/carboxylesterase
MGRLSMLQESLQQRYEASHNSRDRIVSETPSPPLDFPHRLFVPRSYEPGYAYPLIVWLHSDSSSEMELDGVMESLSTQNFVAIAPRGNVNSRGSERRFQWGQTLTDCAAAEDLVWESVHAAMSSLSIHPDRVFLAGFGGGATMAQWIGLKYPEQLAGVVSLSGAFPRAARALSNWKKARNLEVLFSQCEGSTVCSHDEMARAVKIAFQAGLNFRFVQNRCQSACGKSANVSCFGASQADELHESMLAVANRFMMGIVTGTSIELQPEVSADCERMEFGSN